MASVFPRASLVSRLFESLRLARGLKPEELAARIGASNVSSAGNLIRNFEHSGRIDDEWFVMLRDELRPNHEVLRRCIELDEADALAELERDQEEERTTWEAWSKEPMEPTLIVRYIPGVCGQRPVPPECCGSREQAEAWAAAELARFKAKGYLCLTRLLRTWYQQGGSEPSREVVTFQSRNNGAWMQVAGSSRRFLIGPDGRITTTGPGLDQPC